MKLILLITFIFISTSSFSKEVTTLICRANGTWQSEKNFEKKHDMDVEQIIIFKDNKLISIENTFLSGFGSNHIEGQFKVNNKLDFLKYEIEQVFDDNTIFIILGIRQLMLYSPLENKKKWESVGYIHSKINRKSGSFKFIAKDYINIRFKNNSPYSSKTYRQLRGKGDCKKLENKF